MPNIIEQQDLLKGLPDNRLAMMMQNPSGDIPPFLVAAEAQRRQSIRAQFSGGPQESVVDTLTKQLANVPQNIQAPAQMPPQMPPPQMQQQMPPQAGGVAALQQGMRDGGMVQRYQDQGLVIPSIEGMAASITGMTPEEYMRQREAERIAALGPGRAKYLLQNPTMPKTEAQIAAQEFKAVTEGPFSGFYSPESVYEAAQAVTKIADQSRNPVITGMTVDERKMMQKAPVRTAAPATQPRDPNAGQDDTSYINKMSAREAELRKRQEELLGDSELSSWEKSQKWFAAAQAAIQPGQTNAQATINALAALGGGFAEEKAAQRQSESEKEKAMLQWDLARYEADRAAAAKAAEDRKDLSLGAYKFYAEQAGGNVDAARVALTELSRDRKDYIASLPKDEFTGETKIDPNDEYLKNIEEQMRVFREMITGAVAQRSSALKGYGSITGTDPSVTVFTGDGLSTYNR